MATHDYSLANQSGAAFRTDLNNALAAIQSNNSNSSSPATTVAYQWWIDTSANIIKIRNSSNNAWINLFTTAGGVDVDAASNFNEDVTFKGASHDVVWDKSENCLEFADNAKAKFGTHGDTHIYHNGSNSYISHRGTGSLILEPKEGENGLVLNTDGSAVLYYDNARMLETDGNGIFVFGAEGGNANLYLYADEGDDDHDKWSLVADGSASVFSINNRLSGGFEVNLKAFGNNAVDLYYDNAVRLATTANGLKLQNTNNTFQLSFVGASSNEMARIDADQVSSSRGDLRFYSEKSGNIQEKARITDNLFLIGNQDGSISSGSGFSMNVSDGSANNANAVDVGFFEIRRRVGASNKICEIRGTAGRLEIYGDGDVENSNGNYSVLSDVNLKENIVDAKSQWDDIKNIKVRNFNFKEDAERQLSTHTQIGVVAQELETVCPNLVYEGKHEKMNSEGKLEVYETLKGVKSSIIYMKAVKCLQEAQTRIETLETKVAALEAA